MELGISHTYISPDVITTKIKAYTFISNQKNTILKKASINFDVFYNLPKHQKTLSVNTKQSYKGKIWAIF